MQNLIKLCDIVRETSFAIHKYLRKGNLEKNYENSLMDRLRKQGIHVKQQNPIQVLDEDGTLLGEFFADIFAEAHLIIELKACKTLGNEHVAQLLGYLRATNIKDRLLINFGAPKLQTKKYVLSK